MTANIMRWTSRRIARRKRPCPGDDESLRVSSVPESTGIALGASGPVGWFMVSSRVWTILSRLSPACRTLEPIPPSGFGRRRTERSFAWGGAEVLVVATPGHAIHHNAYLVEGLAFTGDVGGVRVAGGPVLPPTPPPDIDLPVWRASLARLRGLKPVALYPTHFDRFDDVEEHLDALEVELASWAGWVKARIDEGKDEAAIVPEFEAWLAERLREAGVSEEGLVEYGYALPFAMNVTGLTRYWENAARG
jgi:glyoxylase-like metal-dependent hydrolase (beta-lactamase superfamily II)